MNMNYSLHLQASLLKWGLLFSTPFVTTEVAKQFTRWWDTQTTSDHTIPKASWASYLPVDRLKVLHRKPIPCDNSILSVFKVRQQGLTVHREAHTSSHLCILSAVCFICLRMRRTFYSIIITPSIQKYTCNIFIICYILVLIKKFISTLLR